MSELTQGAPAGDDEEAAAPTPPEPAESTGDPRVDSALAELTVLDDRDTADHPAVFEEVHRRLQDALADLDTE